MKEVLAEKGISSEINTDIQPEPTEQNIEEVFQLFSEGGHDAILGIGGGSVLDAAKILSVLKTNEKPISALIGTNLVEKPGVPLVLIPTTSGTGSEVTPKRFCDVPGERIKDWYGQSLSAAVGCDFRSGFDDRSSKSDHSCNRNGCIYTRTRILYFQQSKPIQRHVCA
jgi:alcohol dehydrogenase class IV